MPHCDRCGEPLFFFEGEWLCQDCVYFDAVAERDLATDEALAILNFEQAQQPEPPTWDESSIPF